MYYGTPRRHRDLVQTTNKEDIMVRADQIQAYRTTYEDYAEAERIKALIAALRVSRKPFYLNLAELEPILRWKLRTQFKRQEDIRKANTDGVVRKITECAFGIRHSDADYETELRVRILCCMRGVAVPVASAILALSEPSHYCVIDFRGWRQVFGEDKRTFEVSDYKRYLSEVKRLAAELGWEVQETDAAIWEHDRRVNRPE